jgi:hypothetical protein
MQPTRTLLKIVGFSALAAIPLLGGCNIVGYVASAIPQTIDARYEPPKTPMLVLVENRQNPEMAIPEADQLTAFIVDDLVTYKVAPLVDQKKLDKLRDDEKNINKMTISQIGKAVGAEQVLYVDLQRLNVGGQEEGIPTHGRLEAIVQIVDVKSGKTAFPAMGQGGWPVNFETPMASLGMSRQNPEAVRETLLRTAGTEISRLFHDYTVQ